MITEHAIDWSTQWREEGRQQGRREGRQQGEVALLERQLQRRFGRLSHEVLERVRNADAEQLLEWGERFVTATTIEEIFSGRPDHGTRTD